MKSLLFMLFVFIAAIVVPALAAFWALVGALEHKTLFHPSREFHATPASVKLRFQEASFSSADGTTLHGWWIPVDRARGTVVYCHGNGGNISDVLHVAPEFHRRRLNLLLWDYRGYGRSGGRPGEQGIRADALAAYDVALALAPKLPVIVYGFSLGGAVAVQLAADRRGAGADGPAALVVESSFASAADMAQRMYPYLPAWLLRSRYDSAASAAKLDGLPKLFAHSPDDEVLPWETGGILFDAAAEPKTFVATTGGHLSSSLLPAGAPGQPAFDAFLNSVLPP